MNRSRVVLLVVLVSLFAASAQATRWELSAYGGYRWGGTVKGENSQAEPLVELDINDGATVGIAFDLRTSIEMLLLEVFWEHQFSDLSATVYSTGDTDQLGSLTVDYFHGGFLYEFSSMYDTSSDPPMRPFLGFTLGATRFGPEGDLEPEWRFSIGFLLGVKYFPWERVGIRVQTRLTTTYFANDPQTFTDPTTGQSYSLTNAGFMNQYDVTGGLVLEF